jgi:hypothetical protein
MNRNIFKRTRSIVLVTILLGLFVLANPVDIWSGPNGRGIVAALSTLQKPTVFTPCFGDKETHPLIFACRPPFWPRMMAIPSTAPQITDIWVYLGRANDGQRVTVRFAILFTDLNGDVNKFIVGCKSSDSGAICAPPETPSPGERSYEVSAKGITKGRIIWEIGCTMDSHVKTSYRFTLADAAGFRSETADWMYFTHWATGTPVRNALPIAQCTRLVSLYVESQ